MGNKKVLVVDDEKKVLELMKVYLEKEGYSVISATDGQSALELAESHRPDLILLDLNLPRLDGLEVCRNLRRHDRKVPIIMLTARDEETDKIVGLELGADDYITKPFSPREVMARIRALFRRLDDKTDAAEKISASGLELDPARHEAKYEGGELVLTPAEFNLLVVLAGNPGRVYTRLQLLDQAFGDTYEGYERTIDVHIKNIRKKMTLLSPSRPAPLRTVHGVGYKLEKQ